MAQHDYDVANGTGGAVRADLNAALDAIVTNNSGATAPSVTFPFMFWYDTANSLMKQRNAANTAWVVIDTSVYLPLTGGTLTGGLIIAPAAGSINLILNKAASGSGSNVTGQKGGLNRWQLALGTATAESGGNVGSDFGLNRYNDAGTFVDQPLTIARSSGLVTVLDGATISGVLTTNGIISLNSGNIQFPATQVPSANVNTLDDYEEGPFTPGFSASGCIFSYAEQVGTYIKTGRYVYFQFWVKLNATGNTIGAQPLSATGFPFVADSIVGTASGLGPFVIQWGVSVSSYLNVQFSLTQSSTSGSISGLTAAATAWTVVNASNLLSATGGSSIRFSGVYQTTA